MQTVLIADDRPRLRQQLDEGLRQLGYFTILTETAQEALGILRSVHVDLLLTRERLSDAEGTVVAEIARRRGLDELVVVLLAEDAAEARGVGRDGVVDAVLGTDVELRTVFRVVRRLLRPVVLKPSPSAGLEPTCALARA